MPDIQEVILDGEDVTGHVFVDDNFIIDLAFDVESGTITYALTSEMSFIDRAFDILHQTFLPNCFDCQHRISLKIRPECCPIVFIFEILSEGVSFDPYGCEAKVSAVQDTDAMAVFRYLSSNVWWLSGITNRRFWQENQLPQVRYIVEPNFWSDIGLFAPDLGKPKNQLYHYAPALIDIFNWNASLAGSGFISQSIFQQYPEYQRTGVMPPANIHGHTGDNVNADVKEINFPIQTTIQLLESLVPVFNADFRFINGILRFETREFWESNIDILDSLDSIVSEGRIEENPFVQAETANNKAYGKFSYQRDNMDHACNSNYYFFSDIIEWNPGGENRCLRGEYPNEIDFGCTHIVGDEGWILDLSSTRPGAFDRISNDVQSGTMYMIDGRTEWPKLVMLHPDWRADPHVGRLQSRIDFNQIVGPSHPTETGWQLSFREDEPDGLYHRFHKYSAPGQGCAYVGIGDIEWLPVDFCDTVNRIINSGLNVGITTPWGTAFPTEGLTINFTQQTVTLRATSIRCCENE